jgi:hypothetical protein
MSETLSYAPRKAIKSQVLVDFLAEWTDTQLLTGATGTVTTEPPWPGWSSL